MSVGNRKFRIKRSVTPPLTPISAGSPPGSPFGSIEGLPVTIPANTLAERVPPRVRSSRFSTLEAATDKITISRNVLFGLCLTTFAFGIVTTLAIDHMHARASEAPREPEPVVLQTTPIEPAAKPAAEIAVPTPVPTSSSPALPQPAAAEAVVVQLPPLAEKAAEKPAGKLLAHLPPPAPRAVRPIADAPVRAAAATSHKRTGAAAVPSDSSSSGTEAAPDEDSAMPAPTKKKWVDPFDQ